MKILATNKNLGAKTQKQRNWADVARTIISLLGTVLIALNLVDAADWADLTAQVDILIGNVPTIISAVVAIWGILSSIFNEEAEEVEQQLRVIG